MRQPNYFNYDNFFQKNHPIISFCFSCAFQNLIIPLTASKVLRLEYARKKLSSFSCAFQNLIVPLQRIVFKSAPPDPPNRTAKQHDTPSEKIYFWLKPLTRTTTSTKRFLRSLYLIHVWSMRYMRRPLHNGLEAVVGLCQSMDGSALFCVPPSHKTTTHLPPCEWRRRINEYRQN